MLRNTHILTHTQTQTHTDPTVANRHCTITQMGETLMQVHKLFLSAWAGSIRSVLVRHHTHTHTNPKLTGKLHLSYLDSASHLDGQKTDGREHKDRRNAI